MASVKNKAHLKPESKKTNQNQDGKEAADKETPQTPERRGIQFERLDQDVDMKDSDMMERREEKKKLRTRRIWGPKGSSSSSALYEIAATPQRIVKEKEDTSTAKKNQSKHTADTEAQDLLKQMKDLSIKMEAELHNLKAKSTEPTTNEQTTSQLTSYVSPSTCPKDMA